MSKGYKIGLATLAAVVVAYGVIYAIKYHTEDNGLKRDQGALTACHDFYIKHTNAVSPSGLNMPAGAVIGPLCLNPNKITHGFLGLPVYKPASSIKGTFN